MDPIKQAQRSIAISDKIGKLFKRRVDLAQQHYRHEQWQYAVEDCRCQLPRTGTRKATLVVPHGLDVNQ